MYSQKAAKTFDTFSCEMTICGQIKRWHTPAVATRRPLLLTCCFAALYRNLPHAMSKEQKHSFYQQKNKERKKITNTYTHIHVCAT